MISITNRNKRSHTRPRYFNCLFNIPVAQEPSPTDNCLVQPWVFWFAASIRQGQEWLSHAFTTQAAMFYTYNNRLNIDSPITNRLDSTSRQFFM